MKNEESHIIYDSEFVLAILEDGDERGLSCGFYPDVIPSRDYIKYYDLGE